MSNSANPTNPRGAVGNGSRDDAAGKRAGQPRLLRVTCPRGHALDAPCTLNGQDVVCPYCGSRFLFSYENSEQYQHERPPGVAEDQPGRKSWIDWITVAATAAIVGAVAVERYHCLDWL